MKTEWILVADAVSAQIFRRESDRDPLVPLETLRHGESGRKSSDLGDDRLGHGSADRSHAGVSFEPRTDPKRREHEHFARQLAHRLAQALQQGECGRISIYAPAPFLGELRHALDAATRKALRVSIDIDLVAYGLDELERRIGRALAEHGAT